MSAQAKGILIARGAPGEEAAFAMLATASERSNVKLRAVARQVVQAADTRAANHQSR